MGNFGTVIAKEICVHDGASIQLVQMGKDVYGNGWVETRSAGGKALVRLHAMQDSSRCTGSITADGWLGRAYYIYHNAETLYFPGEWARPRYNPGTWMALVDAMDIFTGHEEDRVVTWKGRGDISEVGGGETAAIRVQTVPGEAIRIPALSRLAKELS